MLKYKLKKGVSLKVGMTFRYNSNEELKALANALDVYDKIPSSQSTLRHDGFLIIKGYNNEETNYFQIEKVMFSKYLTKSTEYLVKKKDFFKKIKDIDTEVIDKELKKIELDNANDVNVDGDKFEKSLDGCSFREGLYSNDNTKSLSVLERLYLLRNDLVQNKQYEIASEIRDIESRLRTSHRNSSVVSKGIICGTFKVDTIDHNDSTSVNRQETNVKNTGVQDFFDMLYKNKIAVVSKDESNTEYKKDISNICSVAYLNYIYRGLELVKYIDGSVVLLIPPSDKHTAIDLKLLKDYILEQDIKKVNYDHIVNQYKSVGYGYSIEELKDENGIIKKYLIKPDGSKMIIE